MKATMRGLAVIKEDAVQVTEMIIKKLTETLGKVCKNPSNPHFNHYLFESIAVLVRSVCSTDAKYVQSFEGLLFPPFNHVLQMEVTEFTPYVFQVLAQLLEYSSASELSAGYEGLFQPLLTPALWESKGNVPALTRLVCAYVFKGGKQIIAKGHLLGILGVFQKLISSKANEHYGFLLMGSLVEFAGADALRAHIVEVFNILLMRLQNSKTVRYTRHISLFFSLVIGKWGASAWLQILNSVQPGLGGMLLKQVWLPCVMTESAFNRSDTKTMIVGMIMLMKEPDIAGMDNGNVWATMVCAILKLVGSGNVLMSSADDGKHNEDGGDDVEIEIRFDSSFSKLHFAGKPVTDKFPDISDPAGLLAKSIQECCALKPGALSSLLQAECRNPKVIEACGELNVETLLGTLLQKYGLSLT